MTMGCGGYGGASTANEETARVNREIVGGETKGWPPLKMALWRVLMAENLNDGHYIKAFDLIEKLYAAVQAAGVEPPITPEVVETDAIAKIVLLAMGRKRQADVYGTSYANSMNAEIAKKAAEEIAALFAKSAPQSSAVTGEAK